MAKKQPDLDEISLQFFRIKETSRVIRWAIVAIAITVCIWRLSNAWAVVAGAPEPTWVKLVLVILGALGIGALPGIVVFAKFNAYLRYNGERNKNLEIQIDTQRESSGLSKKGDTPHESD